MKELLVALTKFRQDCPPLIKDADVSFKQTSYSYIKLETILEIVTPVLEKNGLIIVQYLDYVVDKPALTTLLIHKETEQKIKSTTVLTLAKQDPQAQGSSISYHRRYSIVTILGLPTEDDDGRKATFTEEELEIQSKPSKPLKEVTDKANLVTEEQFKELVFSCSKLGIDKDEAKKFWREVRGELGLTRGNYDPKTTSWDNTHNIENDDVPKIYDILEKYKTKKEKAK